MKKLIMEANMKKFITLLEDLWVAVAFAEAGEYDSLTQKNIQPRYSQVFRMHVS
jgi:hypothetical protein